MAFLGNIKNDHKQSKIETENPLNQTTIQYDNNQSI